MSEPNPEDNDALKNVVLAFINLIPNPTDDQTHALAGLLGFEFLEFETRLREVLTPYLEEDDDHSLPLDDEIELDLNQELDTPLETFLLAFYMLNPEPSEEQLMILSVLVNLTTEELEAETYNVINRLLETHPQGQDLEFDELDLDDDFENDDTIDEGHDVSDSISTDTEGDDLQPL